MMEEFFNLSEEIAQRLESKRSETEVHMQPEQKVGRPTCTTWYTTTVRSTEWSTDCMTQFLLRLVDRSVDRLARAQFLLELVDRRKGRSTGAVERQLDLLVLSGFEPCF